MLRENPEHPDALNLMGVLAVAASQYRIAVDYLKKAIEFAPDQAIYLNNLGNALVISSHAEEAVTHLERAVKLEPTYAEAWTNLGKAWRNIGNIEKAGKYLSQALKGVTGLPARASGTGRNPVRNGTVRRSRRRVLPNPDV